MNYFFVNCHISKLSVPPQVIRRFRSLTDRTDLPTELQAELETVRSQEREWGARHYQHRDRR